jgi:hypothetical protein
LAAPVRKLDLAELISEDHRQHRRTLRVAYGAAVALMTFLLVAVWQFQSSLAAGDRERDQSVLASVAHAYRVLYLDPLQAVDDAHKALTVKRTPEGEQALRIAMDVGAHRLRSRQEEGDVLGSGVGYLMERWRRGEVLTKLRNDGRYALVASERGQDGPNPPGKVYLIRLDDRRTPSCRPGTTPVAGVWSTSGSARREKRSSSRASSIWTSTISQAIEQRVCSSNITPNRPI